MHTIYHLGYIMPNGDPIKKKRIGKKKIKKEPGYLYYIGRYGYVHRTPMARNKRRRREKIGEEKINKRNGYLYYLDKSGYVCEVEMVRKRRRGKNKKE